jgi:sugar O-acyltransferase (sialic acid O-acetyltransferase NeuD family)
MNSIVIVGASGHARLAIDAIEKQGRYSILGLLDRYLEPGFECMGYPVLGTEDDLPRLASRGVEAVLIGVGDNWTRGLLAARLERLLPGLEFATVVHPSASIARGVTIGEGSLVLAGAVVNAQSALGRHTILGSRASLDHDSTLGDFASLGPNATTGGDVCIGEYSAVAISATLLHGVKVGAHTVIGAGALAVKSVPSGVVAYGVPARVVHGRNPGDKYL